MFAFVVDVFSRRFGGRGWRRRCVTICVLALVAMVVGWSGTARASQPGNPMAGAPWYVDSGTAAAGAQRAAQDSGNAGDANALNVIAGTPQSFWFVARDSASSGYVLRFFGRAASAPGDIVVITLHGLPQQVCSGENAPGAGDAARYRSWIDGFAQTIGMRRAVVFLEPDALAASSCLSPADRGVRLALLSYASQTLSALPHTGVYIDAGAGDWRAPRDMARLLKAAGVKYARGFALNTTHFDWTSSEVAYGVKLSHLLGGKHFVVNTAFNGRGPHLIGRSHDWCNPPGRALGPLPTVKTRNRLADAFFWVANPGLSDGSCNGGPTVGTFWLAYALGLVHRTAGAPDFPVEHHR